MSASAALQLDRVGPYQLIKAIGAGGSARVDLARIDRAYGFQRHVVIKRPLEHLRGDARASDSLRREARLGGLLRHPNLIAILDAGVHDGYDYLVLEYIHGGSLRELMQTETGDGSRVRDVPLEVALAIVRDVARGVHEAHELRDETGAPLGLVHRDVSPGNVLVGRDGAIKLADFGIAKETRVATLSGSMHGTVTYMAPEQCRGHAFDRRADVFSLGVILYELVTGTRLFWADNDVASLHRVLAGTVPRPRRVKPSIAPVLEDIILTAVASDPEKRFPHAKAIADALEHYGAGVGLILAARSVARWVGGVVGSHDAPWVTSARGTGSHATATPAGAEEDTIIDTSLVALIEATPPPQDLPVATFGPSDAAVVEDVVVDTQPSLAPVRARGWRTLWLAVVAACAAAGVAIAVLATRTTERSPTPATAPSAPSVTVEPPVTVEPANVESPAPNETPSAEAAQTAAQPIAPVRKRKSHAVKPAEKTHVETGSAGSAATPAKPPPNVEWDPTLLLPSDKKKK